MGNFNQPCRQRSALRSSRFAIAIYLGGKETTRFRWNRQNYELQHGEVVEFDSRILHSVPPLKAARYSLQFRKIQ